MGRMEKGKARRSVLKGHSATNVHLIFQTVGCKDAKVSATSPRNILTDKSLNKIESALMTKTVNDKITSGLKRLKMKTLLSNDVKTISL